MPFLKPPTKSPHFPLFLRALLFMEYLLFEAGASERGEPMIHSARVFSYFLNHLRIPCTINQRLS
jgi:hypothetical protein